MLAVAVVVPVADVARRRAFLPPLRQQVAELAAGRGDRLLRSSSSLGPSSREKASIAEPTSNSTLSKRTMFSPPVSRFVIR